MTEKDKKQIEKAKKLNCIFWYEIDNFTFDTIECKENLQRIKKYKYLQEENQN